MTLRLKALLAAFLGLLASLLWWRRRAKVAEVKAEVAEGQRDVAIATHEATVIVDDRQAEARELADAAEHAPAVVAATTPAERVDAATDLLRSHPMNAATASRRAADRVRSKIVKARKAKP